MSFSKDPPPPWYLICREAVRGTSLESLAHRYNVSTEQIEQHLAQAIKIAPAGNRTVRTSSEINKASMMARSDLIDVLQQAISELVISDKPRLSQLSEFTSLLQSAQTLFQWPKSTIMRVQASMQPVNGYGAPMTENGAPTEAVNLSLIATTPSDLARMASEMASEQPQADS